MNIKTEIVKEKNRELTWPNLKDGQCFYIRNGASGVYVKGRTNGSLWGSSGVGCHTRLSDGHSYVNDKNSPIVVVEPVNPFKFNEIE